MKLIENVWSKFWSLASVRWAWFLATLAAFTTAYPNEWAAIVDSVPQPYRTFLPFVVFMLHGGSQSAARLIHFRSSSS